VGAILYMKNDLKINLLEKRIKKLEEIIDNFMENYGPEIQEKRAKRDRVWDEMVRVVSIQRKNQ
jgi:hypothetical protein